MAKYTKPRSWTSGARRGINALARSVITKKRKVEPGIGPEAEERARKALARAAARRNPNGN